MSLVLIFWFLCIFRAEVERVRCGLLGDGVSGRANVISDKEFRDKNKVLTTSNQQKHGEANNVLFSVRPKTEWCLHLVESKFFFGYVHFSSISILFPWRVVDTRVFLLGHFAVHTEHGTKQIPRQKILREFSGVMWLFEIQSLEIHHFSILS